MRQALSDDDSAVTATHTMSRMVTSQVRRVRPILKFFDQLELIGPGVTGVRRWQTEIGATDPFPAAPQPSATEANDAGGGTQPTGPFPRLRHGRLPLADDVVHERLRPVDGTLACAGP